MASSPSSSSHSPLSLIVQNAFDHDKKKRQSFLIFGDGDFSFSLDLARYLTFTAAAAAVSSSRSVNAAASGKIAERTTQEPLFRLIATGFDSLDELSRKYKDSPSILRRLQKLNSSHGTGGGVSISVHHSVNAVNDDDCSLLLQANQVLFNHPHLGTEDAVLHSCFLRHLFHSVSHRWLAPDGGGCDSDRSNCNYGRFHLTLARGQYERWDCEEAAHRADMVLVDRCDFVPPPVSVLDGGNPPTPCYQYRRHQTGKSFASRTVGCSETFTFVRRRRGHHISSNNKLPLGGEISHEQQQQCSKTHISVTKREKVNGRPFWYKDAAVIAAATQITTGKKPHVGSLTTLSFSCPHCDKLFLEERSLKNHLLNKHNVAQAKSKKRKRKTRNASARTATTMTSPSNITAGLSRTAATVTAAEQGENPQKMFACQYCPRVFEREQALNDHTQAKHAALHCHIVPDWYQKKKDNIVGTTSIPGTTTSLREMSKIDEPSAKLTDDVLHFSTGTADTKYPFSCKVCGMVFGSKVDAMPSAHLGLFSPSNSERSLAEKRFPCTFCSKLFREKRGQLQHENFCPQRPSSR